MIVSTHSIAMTPSYFSAVLLVHFLNRKHHLCEGYESHHAVRRGNLFQVDLIVNERGHQPDDAEIAASKQIAEAFLAGRGEWEGK